MVRKLFSLILAATFTVATEEVASATVDSIAPLHATQNLDIEEEERKAAEAVKALKIEKVMKEYEKQVSASSDTNELDEDGILEILEKMLDKDINVLSKLEDKKKKKTNKMADLLALSGDDIVFETLQQMNGDEFKKLFEAALDGALLSIESVLQEVSPNALEDLRKTVRQLKAFDDYTSYTFQSLNESQLATIRSNFAKHRFDEMHQTFELLLSASNSRDRQIAFETAIFLFQLADDEANTLTE
ncbi:unnamed protein product [Peronospora belbahrii]|uniref:Uncharacterized protein n=1 Tax=Peronospora belbahrii TaxID=622444 RepID=A0AAU9L194_9STRA|nr:unnamed protein product [Peronospora belbahrii]